VLVEGSGAVQQSDRLTDVNSRLIRPNPVAVARRASRGSRPDTVGLGETARDQLVGREKAYASLCAEGIQRARALWRSVAGRLAT
jgi:hypothetical protein